MRIHLCTVVLTFALVFVNLSLFSQVSITGPTCVVPGTIYHYKISGPWKASTSMQVCVSGGVLKGKDSVPNTCTPQGGAPLGGVLVQWTGTGSKSITISSSEGNKTISISSINSLQAGSIAASSQKQVIGSDSIIFATIVCGAAIGGACSPSYSYQWQQSSDRVSWTNILGATSKDLPGSRLKTTTFYRRKDMETTSGTIVYSDVAEVFVIIDIVTQP
jgi:hypothetical protein